MEYVKQNEEYLIAYLDGFWVASLNLNFVVINLSKNKIIQAGYHEYSVYLNERMDFDIFEGFIFLPVNYNVP